MKVEVGRERFRQAILTALADKEMMRIIDCATLRPRSVNEVIREANIPHSTAYRKIKWMLEAGLLLTERIEITSDGKKFSLFKSTIKSVDVKYDQGKILVEIEYNVDILERTAERLFSLGPG